MTLIKYRPQNTHVDALFDRLTRDMWPSFERLFGGEAEGEVESIRLPRTNIEETKDAYVFSLEMPGLSKKDVEVTVEGDVLTIRGEKTARREEGTELVRSEIRSTKFERHFNLGGAVDADAVKARMEDGILVVTLPKKAEKVGRKIDIS
jgi:HSP20 family protein